MEKPEEIVDELDRILPDEIKKRGTSWGNELVLPYDEALQAIAVATQHQIAILGFEAFEITSEGLLTVDMADASSYVPFTGDWKAYLNKMNQEGERWIRQHRFGEDHGYILTSASEKEFASLRRPSK